jgi:hypothetical protein
MFISPQRGSVDLALSALRHGCSTTSTLEPFLELTPSGCCSRTECGPPLRAFPCRHTAVDPAVCPPCTEDTDDENRMREVTMMIMVRVGIVDMIMIQCRVGVSS